MSESRRFPSVDAFTDSWFNENAASVDQNGPTSADIYPNAATGPVGVRNEAEGYVRVPSGYVPSPAVPNDVPQFGPAPTPFAFLDQQSRPRMDYMVPPDPAATAPSAASWELPRFDLSFAETLASAAPVQPSPQPSLTWPVPQAQPDVTRPWSTGMADTADLFGASPASRPIGAQPQPFTPAFSSPQPETSFASRNAPPASAFFELPSAPLFPPNPPRNMASFPGNGVSAAGIAPPSLPSFAPVPGPMAAPATPVQPFAGQVTSFAMPNWPVEAGLKRVEPPSQGDVFRPVAPSQYANSIPPTRTAPPGSTAPYETWPLAQESSAKTGWLSDDYASAERLAFGRPPEVLRPLSPVPPAFTNPLKAASSQPAGLGALPRIQSYDASGIGTSASSDTVPLRPLVPGFNLGTQTQNNRKYSNFPSLSRFLPVTSIQAKDHVNNYMTVKNTRPNITDLPEVVVPDIENTKAFFKGGYSIVGSSLSGFRQMGRRVGVFGDEEKEKYIKDFIILYRLSRLAYKESGLFWDMFKEFVKYKYYHDQKFFYYVAGRFYVSFRTGLGLVALFGDIMTTIESNREFFERLIERERNEIKGRGVYNYGL